MTLTDINKLTYISIRNSPKIRTTSFKFYCLLVVSSTTPVFGLYFNSFNSISLHFCMWCIQMVRHLVLKFGKDWMIISYSCLYPSMVNLVSFYALFNMVGVGEHLTKFNIEVYGQLYEIILQSSPTFNTSCRTIHI